MELLWRGSAARNGSLVLGFDVCGCVKPADTLHSLRLRSLKRDGKSCELASSNTLAWTSAGQP